MGWYLLTKSICQYDVYVLIEHFLQQYEIILLSETAAHNPKTPKSASQPA